ncbi:histone acetylation protein-domain-containing protein [Thamnocephalis sphaerospora]|uniref:histone acetyltransferase n=1 Tax=Thamnocephalis sphaerospora TaxID=78915 RepID=A0A4P9XNZ8_9FUNG|nr:histone acetylation protein-domain-containing protein [Thamnocephalis sphaerospora]|eukprot:RKP07562.1 histone acetylation protein-domain-containing protein [Thamnocephalis sphaerospora]
MTTTAAAAAATEPMLASFLDRWLARVQSPRPLRAWSMCSSFEPARLFPGDRNRDRSTRRRSWLLLVDQLASTDDADATDTEAVLVAGVTIYEYRHAGAATSIAEDTPKEKPASATAAAAAAAAVEAPEETTLYVEKVDTTGYMAHAAGATSRLSAAVALVLGYLDYMRTTRTPVAPLNIHVFARAQPQYLFANSAENSCKRALDDRALVRWWLRTLEALQNPSRVPVAVDSVDAAKADTANEVSSDGIEHQYWLVPGYAVSELGEWARAAAGHGWCYGVPYAPNAQARRVLPRFPDDPIARMLDGAASAGMSVCDFLALLALGEECGSGRVTGVYTLRLTACTNAASLPTGEKVDSASKERDDADGAYAAVTRWLMRHAGFATLAEARTCTQKMAMLCKKHHVCPHIVPAVVVASSPVAADGKPADAAVPTESKGVSAVVNNLQSLVRKRPVSTPTETPRAVNNLQGLIKRRKPA